MNYRSDIEIAPGIHYGPYYRDRGTGRHSRPLSGNSTEITRRKINYSHLKESDAPDGKLVLVTPPLIPLPPARERPPPPSVWRTP